MHLTPNETSQMLWSLYVNHYDWGRGIINHYRFKRYLQHRQRLLHALDTY